MCYNGKDTLYHGLIKCNTFCLKISNMKFVFEIYLYQIYANSFLYAFLSHIGVIIVVTATITIIAV